MSQKPETETGIIAADTLRCVVESYIDFINIVEWAMNFADMPYKIEKRLLNTIKERKQNWEPILQKLKDDLGVQE